MLKSFFLSQKAKCNFKSKAQVHEIFFFLMKWNCFLQCRRQIFTCLSFLQKKVILERNCKKSTSLELLRTPILCLVQTKQIMRMRGPQMLKSFFLSQKK